MSIPQSNTNVNNLMGFSVHQPSVGAQLQFFPPMGSQQLDEMIDAYVPGNASILDKRAAVTCEFFQYSNATGELFKFFMVFPSRTSESFESPISLNDSGYGSHNTSPVMSETQWASTSTSKSKARSSSKKVAVADFSHLPGMKIMTKDGLDVTNSASRGCKTKEQRDHAHLMRIIKACDSCRRKKIRCDPSHKKRSSHSQSPEPKPSKKIKKASIARQTAPTSVSNQDALFSLALSADVDQSVPQPNYPFDWSMSSLESIPADEVDIFAETESWDQFINYGDESVTTQDNYDLNAYRSSPTNTISTNTNSPSQPFTPNGRGLGSDVYDFASAGEATAIGRVDYAATFADNERAPALPYLTPGGVENGNNYVDFNLYSPSSSSESDLGSSNEIAAASPDRQGIGRVDRDQLDESYGLWSEHRHRVDPVDHMHASQNRVSSHAPRTPDVGIHVPFASRDASASSMSSVYSQQAWSSSEPSADALQDIVPAYATKQRVPAGMPHDPPIATPASGAYADDNRESPDTRRNVNIDLEGSHRTLNLVSDSITRPQTMLVHSSPEELSSGRSHASTGCIDRDSSALNDHIPGRHMAISSSDSTAQPDNNGNGALYRLEIISSSQTVQFSAIERGAVSGVLPARNRRPALFTECPGDTAFPQRANNGAIVKGRPSLAETYDMSTSTVLRQTLGVAAAIRARRPLPDSTNRVSIDATAGAISSSSPAPTTYAGSLAIQSVRSRRRDTTVNSRDVSGGASPDNDRFRGVCAMPDKSSRLKTLAVCCSGLATLVHWRTMGMQSPNDASTSAFFAFATVAALAVFCRMLSCYLDAKLAEDVSRRPLSPIQIKDTRAYDSTPSPFSSSYAMTNVTDAVQDLTSRIRRCIIERGLHWRRPNSTPVVAPVSTPAPASASQRQGCRSRDGVVSTGIQWHPGYLHIMG